MTGISWPLVSIPFAKSRNAWQHVNASQRFGPHQTPAESQRVSEWYQNATEFSTLIDVFHFPFPADPKRYVSMVAFKGMQDNTVDPILSLPAEVSYLIFSFLSVPALDAARYTSRSWWFKITGSRSSLTSVLHGLHHSNAGPRELLKLLDLEANCLCLVGNKLRRTARSCPKSRRVL